MEPTAAVASTAGVDLPDEILEDWAYPAMQAGDRDILTPDCRAEIRAMVAEIRRRRAEATLTREYVEWVVREEIEADLSNGEPASFDVINAAYHISRRVADRLVGASRLPGGGGLAQAECVVAAENVGVDITCGHCAAIFYTGWGVEPHDDSCRTKVTP